MAKFYGSAVKTGKLGGSVFAIRNGETIERQYQPIVANPNTIAQVAARARLKLMSQLSAVMAPVIAMPRVGAVSSRNLFVKTNYDASDYSQADQRATITLTNIKLTRGILSMAMPSVARTEAGRVLTFSPLFLRGFDRVVSVVFTKQADGSLRYANSAVTDVPAGSETFTVTLTTGSSNSSDVIYCYAIRDNTEAARVAFGNMAAPVAESVAQLITSRSLLESDITLSETVSVESNPE